MKEFTVTFSVEVTDTVTGDSIDEYVYDDKAAIEYWLKKELVVDDVKVKGNVKVFEREVEE